MVRSDLPDPEPAASRVAVRHTEAAAPPRRRFTGTEWDRLVREGFFGPHERLELVNGEVRVMSPVGDPHATVVYLAAEACRRAYSNRYLVREEKPLAAGEQRLYPDLVVVEGPPDRFLSRSPRGSEVALLMEVADSTLAYDLGEKAAIYAAARVREYWVADLNEGVLVVHHTPRRRRGLLHGWAYAEVREVGKGRLTPPGARRAVGLSSFLRRAGR